MLTASDPASLPDLSSDYPVPPERIREFREKGHTCLRGLASLEEVACYGPAIEAAAQAHKLEKRGLEELDTYGQAFLQIINLWLQSRVVQAFVFSRRFAKVAAQLLEVPAVRLYHDQALFKEPGGGYTPWHQDQFYWPLATDRTITLWMPLVDVPAEVGTMYFASGSHRIGHLGEYRIGDESQAILERLIAADLALGQPGLGSDRALQWSRGLIAADLPVLRWAHVAGGRGFNGAAA